MKIAFVAGNEQQTTFIAPIAVALSTEHEVTECYTLNQEKIRQACEADVIWLEWAREHTMAITQQFPAWLRGKRVIVRLHSYEALYDLHKQVDWSVVTDIIGVAKHVLHRVMPHIHSQNPKIAVHHIPNGVDVEKFTIPEGKQQNRRIAHLGNINNKKGPDKWPDIIHTLLKHTGEDIHFHFGGKFQDSRYEVYLPHIVRQMGVEDRVHFDGAITDVPGWFADKSYVLCASPWESQNMAVMEGMACGLKPLVHNFPGACDIYREEHIWTTLDDLIFMVGFDKWQPQRYRDFIVKNYRFEDMLERIRAIL